MNTAAVGQQTGSSRKQDGPAKLVRYTDNYQRAGWALDVAETDEAQEVRELFGTTVLPLPLTGSCSAEDALTFASMTALGLEHGVVAAL